MKKPLTAPKLLIEGAGQCADLIYGSGFIPVDPVVFLDEGSSSTLVVPMLEYGRAKVEARKSKVFLPEEILVPPGERRRLASIALYLLKFRKIKQIQVPTFFPAGIARELEKNGISIDIITGPIYPERAIKDSSEVRKITEAQSAAVSAMKAAVRLIREASVHRNRTLVWKKSALTSERVREIIDIELLKSGCTARDTIVAGGRQATDPHDRGSGPLKAGEAIVIDIFPQHKQHHYWGDITRTVCKGTPSPALARMYQTVLKAQKMALDNIKAGVKGSDIHDMISAFFDGQGYPTTVKNGVVRGFFHGTGHGVGLDIHESPSISLAPVELSVGNVVTVEPGLYDPDIGGIRIEDTVLVTRAGIKILCPLAKTFVI
ncbi:MAG TPA: Xaa-Pro peptidase family protein [Kiritimatiellia bacterium]|nr:Xaa-Pro peptidase family protein [Kiritimatiellia bacterium]